MTAPAAVPKGNTLVASFNILHHNPLQQRHYHSSRKVVLSVMVASILIILSVQSTLTTYLSSSSLLQPNIALLTTTTTTTATSYHTNSSTVTASSSSTSLSSSKVPKTSSTSEHERIIASLIQLTKSHEPETSCPSPSLVWVHDTLLPHAEMAFSDHRKIPRIVHISSASRCNHKIIADNLNTWRLDQHYFFLHTDEAVRTILYHHHDNKDNNHDWSHAFPLLRYAMKCLPQPMGAAWIDVWRLLILWKYGGIYADLDTSPVPHMFNATTITPDVDAYFVQERLGSPSQWFMAASPRHPMIYLSILHLMNNVLHQPNLAKFRVVYATGPGAVAFGFASFVRNDTYLFRSPAGFYRRDGGSTRKMMMENHSVTIVGNRTDENMYITRMIDSLHGKDNVKLDIYRTMNMTHLTEIPGTVYKPNGVEESCLERLYKLGDKHHQTMIEAMMQALQHEIAELSSN